MSVDGTRRAEILDTAGKLFASSGLRTSLKEIADACGILPGSLYHHFDSKEAIVVELIDDYRADLDRVAARASEVLEDPDADPVPDQIVELGRAIAAVAVTHRAALLFTLYEAPTAAGEELVQAVGRSPLPIEKAMQELLTRGRAMGSIRDGIALDVLASRICQVLLHLGLGVFHDVRGAEEMPAIRCRGLLDGIAVETPSDAVLDGSAAFRAANDTIAAWEHSEDAEEERLPMLRSVARAEFGRRGFETTTVRDIAKASGLSTGTVYRLIGSKDELLASIMGSFVARARTAWSGVLKADGSVVEKLDALTWININIVDRFSDEYSIQLAWLRDSPPQGSDLGSSFVARLNNVKTLLGHGTRSGELSVPAPSADIRAWSVFELLWFHEDLIAALGPRETLLFARETLLRGAARRT